VGDGLGGSVIRSFGEEITRMGDAEGAADVDADVGADCGICGCSLPCMKREGGGGESVSLFSLIHSLVVTSNHSPLPIFVSSPIGAIL
jgi:hypothetical protein